MSLIRKLTGTPPRTALPRGTIDTQMHMYLPGYPALPGGPPIPGGALPGVEDYRRVMGWLGIDRLVITQGNAHQRDNANLIAAVAAMDDVARGVCVVTGETPQAELTALADAGMAGARIMDLPGGGVGFEGLESVDAIAADMGWALAVQFNGSDLLTHLPRLAALKSRWIFDHHGKFFDGITPAHVDALKGLIDGGRTWFKFAGCYESSTVGGPGYEDIAATARAIAAHAPERIVWGTNWPHNLARSTEDYPDDALLTDTVLSWFPDDAGRRKALVDNPEELFGFPKFR